ncbi:TetR/AcrR family transcriptional regulator [Nocardia takedensis]
MTGRARKQTDGATSSRAAPPRRTQRERAAQAEQALLDAAESLFAERGVDNTSLADVGQVAGYSRGLVNHHFGSKAALVDRLAHRIQDHFVAGFGVEARADAVTVESLAGLVVDYLHAVVDQERTGRAFFVMWGASLAAEASLRPVFAADDTRFRTAAEDFVRAGQAGGSVDPALDPAACAAAVVGMVRGVAAQHLIAPESFDLSAAAEACGQFVVRTLTPPARD